VAPEYSFEERDREKGGTKTYDVTMILGSPYSRLIKINDEPLSAADSAREAQKLQEETARRRSESEAQRQKRIAAYQQERERDHVLLEQVSEAFDFSLVGREQLASRPVYHLHATPKPGYSPPNLHARALTGMTGDL